MNLENFIKDIDVVDEELIIFQKDKLGYDSETVLFDGAGEEATVIVKDGVKYHYLLEVYIAKEFVADFVSSMKVRPADSEIAKRLFEYAMNDA